MDNENMMLVMEALKNKNNFLITAHLNPEGDSIGSQISMYYLLAALSKTAVIVNHDEVPVNLRFLTGSEHFFQQAPDDFCPEAFIVLDCPVKERTGRVAKCVGENGEVINIDHHVSNEFFAEINWVEPGASSVGEMMFELFSRMDVKLEKEAREAIYTAIVTDTGMFNYNNTTSRTHEIVGRLISQGVDPKKMHERIFETRTVSDVRLLGKTLNSLKTEADGKIAYISLTQEMYAEEGVRAVTTDEFINFPRAIEGAEIAIFFKENSQPEKINVSFRSKGKVNVNLLAACFGGGGHAQAAGCTLMNCSLKEAEEKVLAEAVKALKK